MHNENRKIDQHKIDFLGPDTVLKGKKMCHKD